MRLRGWIAIGAGVFLVVLMSWVWIYIARQSTIEGAILCDAATRDQFLNRIYVAFALIVGCGLVAISAGIHLLRTSRPNWPPVIALLTLFIAACVIGANGAAACKPP